MAWVNFPVVDTIQPQSNKLVMGMKIKATMQRNDSYSVVPDKEL